MPARNSLRAGCLLSTTGLSIGGGFWIEIILAVYSDAVSTVRLVTFSQYLHYSCVPFSSSFIGYARSFKNGSC
ncbi:hypothetical protein AYI68_g2989 [Smittium mucronatum]|uniref:Uncharacterized protein n=1 Tax=Smittium mucronatum TaxID=133383 RepID=A0A1R0H188_9FUNG|nr:hypothetical protein AYI68_g2989 [Smittium mucronatum]